MAFIVFEGLDGSGKTTQMEKLADDLKKRGVDVVVTREPGGTPLAEELREILLRKGDEVPHPKCELLVYEASRAQHVANVIRPALMRGAWVISDRFTASGIAFQAGGREIYHEDVEWLNDFATGGLQPDLNILVDVTVEESEKRRGRRSDADGSQQDRLESEKSEFHERVRASYLEQSSKADNWLKLDGNHSVDELFTQIQNELKRREWLES